jgi:lipoyl(octanoyl) transferase
MSLELNILDIGKTTYAEAWEIQKRLFEQRKMEQIPDTLILAEHTPTVTLGLNKKWNSLHVTPEELKRMGIAYHESDRGGGTAYLGPGQLVGYPIMNISPYGTVLSFMRLLEDVMIKTAGDFDIPVERYDVMNPTTEKPYRATWYRNGKNHVLCTKGIKSQIFNGGNYTHHGFCLNVNQNTSYYHLIDPCGFPISEVSPISMQEIKGQEMEMGKVKESIVRNFREVFKKDD